MEWNEENYSPVAGQEKRQKIKRSRPAVAFHNFQSGPVERERNRLWRRRRTKKSIGLEVIESNRIVGIRKRGFRGYETLSARTHTHIHQILPSSIPPFNRFHSSRL